VVPDVQPENKEPPREPATTNNNPIQAQAQEKGLEIKQTEERHEVKQDRGGQPPPVGIELSTFPQQQSTAAMNQRPQRTANTFPTGGTHRTHPLPPHPPQYNPQNQGTPSVSGWVKSWAGGY